MGLWLPVLVVVGVLVAAAGVIDVQHRRRGTALDARASHEERKQRSRALARSLWSAGRR